MSAPVAAADLSVASGYGDAVIDRSDPAGDAVRDADVIRRWVAAHNGFDMAGDLEVEGSGPIDGVTGSCPQVTLSVYGIPVFVTAATSFTIGTTCATLTPGRVVHVRGTLFLLAGQIRVLASHVRVEGGVNTPVEGEGLIAEINGSCPNATLVVRGVSVTLAPGTQYSWQSNSATAGCGDLLVGMLVHIRGEMTPSGQVIASRVQLKSGSPSQVTVRGVVASKSGSCPGIAFMAGTSSVRATSSTQFLDGACSQVVNGAEVEARGSRGSDGRVTAVSVRLLRAAPTNNNPDGEHVSGSGIVATVRGTCPTLTISVFGQTVKTDANTRFRGGRCDHISTGDPIEVRGIRRSGYIQATEISM